MRKTLALCIPAYNAASYLPRLLRSSAAQAIPFDEIWVYNDCSKDDTSNIASAFGAKVFNGEINMGCSFGKNKLAELSNCEYVHFHDADDELYPNFTTLAHKWISMVDCPDVVLFNYEYRDDVTGKLLSVRNFDDAELRTDPLKYAILNQINPFCGLYSRSRLLAVGGYDIDTKILYNEDVAFHCKLAMNGFSFRAENEISIINYRINNSMSAGNRLKCAQAHYHVMERLSEKTGRRYSNEIARKLWDNAVICASLSDVDTSKRASRLSYCLDKNVVSHEPLYLRLLARLNPFWAVNVREKFIRILKPELRQR